MSDLTIVIRRQMSAEDRPYYQRFSCDASSSEMTVADFLRELNQCDPPVDAAGNPAEPVCWECACLQGRCGACAMRINRHPALACSVFLNEAADKHGVILLEPLSKFPVVRDLKVDRSVIFENMKKMKLHLSNRDSSEFGHRSDLQDAASMCCQCGLCLEVCPSFAPGTDFAGAPAMVKAGKILDQNSRNGHFEEMASEYRTRFFDKCCQSLSCLTVCPLHLPLDDLQAWTNALAVWEKLF